MSGRRTPDHVPAAPPLARAPGPEIRPLAERECADVLARNRVARVAYAFDRRVDILPIHYVHDGDWLYGRTSIGAKLEQWAHSHWVAVEVDEVRGLFDWVSVVAHGSVHLLRADGPDAEAAAWEHAVTLLRRLLPTTGTAFDPVPERTILFRIHLDEVSGRECRPAVES